MHNEKFLPVKGYEGLYEVGDRGTVVSLGRMTKTGEKPRRTLVQQKQWTGYVQVGLSLPGKKQKWFKVHRLVADAFIPNKSNKSQVNHINGIKDDNRVENLEWVTPSENQIHAIKKLGKKPSCPALGKPSKKRKLTDEQADAIRKDNRPQIVIAKDYGISQQTVSNIKNGLVYKIAVTW